MAGPTGDDDPPLFTGAKRFRGVGFSVWAGTNEAKVSGAGGATPDWAAVLAQGNNSGANNPHIDAGQYLGFGVEGSLPASGTIRSSTNFILNATGFVSVSGSLLATLTSGSGGTTTTVTAGGGAGAGVILSTGGTERLEIETTGAWQLGGLVGTAGQYLRSSGAGAAPAWASLALSELPSQGADTFLGRLAGAGTPAPQSFASIASTSILYDVSNHTWHRAALSGAIAAAQNSNATMFAGILNAGGTMPDRTRLNFIGFTVADDGGNDRINITAPLGVTDGDKGDITVSGSGAVWQVDTDINKTWTGTHQFNGNSFGANAQTGDVALQALDDILLNASSGLALVAGSGATGFPITTVTPGDIQILADDGIAIDAEGTSGIAINAAGASNFSTSAGNLTLSTTGASTRVVVSGADDVLIESLADAIFVNSASTCAFTTGLNFTAAATGDLLMSAQAGMGFYSGFANAGVASGDFVANASDGLGLFAGYGSANASISAGDMTLCAAAGLQILAGATPITNVPGGVNIDSDTLIRLSTAGTERLEIEADGAWQVSGNTGTAGQVFTSQGNAASPQWGGSVSLDNNVQLDGVISPSIAADQNNWNPTGLATANIVRVNVSGARTITGIAAQPSGTVLYLLNVGSGSFSLPSENASSTAANRFLHGIDSPIYNANMGVMIWYDGTSSRWRIIGGRFG